MLEKRKKALGATGEFYDEAHWSILRQYTKLVYIKR